MLRRRHFVVLCIVQVVILGGLSCDHSILAQPQKPLPLSDYMRTVYKISQESAAESDAQRQKVLDSNLEIAQLAASVAADDKDVESRNKLADAYFKEGLAWSAYRLFQEVQTLTGGDFHAQLSLARIWD